VKNDGFTGSVSQSSAKRIAMPLADTVTVLSLNGSNLSGQCIFEADPRQEPMQKITPP
jgi:hypothetical protein